MGGMGGMGSMFGGKGEEELKRNPRIAKYFEDPHFRNKWDVCQKDPQAMMQFVQTDPRFMDVFKEMTGIDLMDMQEKEMKRKEQMEDMRKKREAEEKKKKEEEERKKKEEKEASLPEEERKRLQAKKEAETIKAKGNELYKKKQF